MSEWPKPYHPLDDNYEPDTTVTVQVYPHMPGQTDALVEWAGAGAVVLVNGGPCVILPTSRPVADRLVGLGDVAIDDGEHSIKALPATELGGSYRPVDFATAPPVD